MFRSRLLRASLGLLGLGLLAGTPACAPSEDDAAASDDDLTSVTARARTLEFEGTVYVERGASDAEILQTVRAQAQTAFGPLRTSDMAVNSRELKDIDKSTFVKRNVSVVDPAGGTPTSMTEVKYTYRDNAVVGLEYATRTAAPLVLMRPDYASETARILTECTANDSEAQEFSSQIWYVFEPKLDQCQTAIRTEQAKVDADREKLAHPQTEVAKSEVDRLYIPITARLGADKTNKGKSYPEYHRLFAGGVKPGKLVVSLVYGLIDHDSTGGPETDTNWNELMTGLDVIFQDGGGTYSQVAGPDQIDLSHFQLASGKVVDSPAFADLVRLHLGTSTLQLSSDDATDLEKQFASRIEGKWLAVERPLRVKIGSGATKDFAIQILVYFGAGSSYEPHKYATKNSDVFVYNGHSSIGYGPLDPKNFTTADFPSSYQLFWIDGCVSYNYYEKDYIPLKQGGTKNLDLVTNGIEAPAWRSGYANGKFVAALLGAKASYKDLLLAAQDTDALRVVDGEVDNQYSGTKTSLRVTLTNR